MDWYPVVKTLHIISATVLFGTGLGIAFFMFFGRLSENLQERYFASRATVLADTVFTFPAVLVQPATGLWLMWDAGYQWSEAWLLISFALYALAGLCWLPVVCLQIKMRNIAREALSAGTALPVEFNRLFRIWFILGWPAFAALVGIFFLMVTRPA